LEFNIEFWEDRDQQLPGETGSTRVEAFVLDAQLSVIAARILSELYGIRPRSLTAVQLVQKFEVQLEEWINSIPARFVRFPLSPFDSC